MVQVILMLLGFTFPNNSINTHNINQNQSETHLNFDTGGEDGQVPPPKI